MFNKQNYKDAVFFLTIFLGTATTAVHSCMGNIFKFGQESDHPDIPLKVGVEAYSPQDSLKSG